MKVLQSSIEEAELTPFQRRWKALRLELNREDSNTRLIAIAILSGMLSTAILLPFIMA